MSRRTYRRSSGNQRDAWTLGFALGGVALAALVLIVFFEAPGETLDFNEGDTYDSTQNPGEAPHSPSRNSYLPGIDTSPPEKPDADAPRPAPDDSGQPADRQGADKK